MASLFDGFSFVAGRVSARRPSCLSLFVDFSFVASRVSARRPICFLLLRQKKVAQEKASRSQGRCAVPCAARIGRVGRKLGFASNMRPPVPPAAALLSPVTTALETELRLLGCAIANSRDSQHLNSPSRPGVCTCSSASAAKRDTTQSACKVSASERARGSGTRSRTPAIETEPSSAVGGGSGLALFEAPAEFSQTPPTASSAGNRAAARSLARFSFAYFSLAKQRKVRRLPGRHPACHVSNNPT